MTRPSADDIDDDEESSMLLNDNAVEITNIGVIFLSPPPPPLCMGSNSFGKMQTNLDDRPDANVGVYAASCIF
ncbi:hypothetical protein DPMN_001799 [Dreissena polymorpha]|uniref:Uncharacterized protein n=1 Tax=Dreissena polymorpha TaxID=45954 RepID=A0A9D4RR61_DREPO|nr:hypothetical protein DPMN_001799 [Dreissena polymorpha]